MKFRVKETAAAASVFSCSLIFCLVVLCGSFLFGDERTGVSEGEDDKLAAAGMKGEPRPVIIIDAGHGGMDGGASASDGTLEKDINLEIAMKLKEIADGYPAETVMTRESDVSLHSDDSLSVRERKRQDLLKRKEIIDKTQGTLAVSIHLNSFPEDVSVYGAQVFYPKDSVKRTDGRTDEQDSEAYARSVQESLEMNISDGRERSVMAKGDFLIFENPTCPMILVECGFLSNDTEREKLKTAEYQEELAAAIWEGINGILSLEKEHGIQIRDSANKT